MTDGAWLFARYAYAPNKLGFCGPPESATLAAAGSEPAAGVEAVNEQAVRAAARRFSGAWHYLVVLAELAGIDDPLDRRVVESYWLGGGLNDAVDGEEFGRRLLDRIGPQAGHYWSHLTPDLLPEAAADHGFHVFGVYPWTRLLGRGPLDPPMTVLDGCRIRPAVVRAREGDRITVSARRLTWEGAALALGEPATGEVPVAVDGLSFVPDAAPGEVVALHWDWLCGRLTPDQAADLDKNTLRRIDITNERLAREH
ncbi:MAG: hypothetical protein EKK42_32940 [Pseudonocardiaceae bacterium]|nr:MAG: hypothetical protein EKK42_32940 [Pseudonocardiaceae bacterium]